MNRKNFISSVSLLSLSAGVFASTMSSLVSKRKNIGLQLYSLRDDIDKVGIKKILKQVSQIGYSNLETANYNDGKVYGMFPKDFKKLCSSLNLNPISTHVSRAPSDNHKEDMAWWDQAIADHKAMGMSYMVMPWSELNNVLTAEPVLKYANYFNEIGKRVSAAGMKFGYHNHDFEFKTKVDGKCVYELLLENTDPEYVSFEMDVYWVVKGGFNPAELINQHQHRIMLLHIKDETVVGESGEIDFKSIFQAAYAQGLTDWFVEVEKYKTNPMQDVKESYVYLNSSSFVK